MLEHIYDSSTYIAEYPILTELAVSSSSRIFLSNSVTYNQPVIIKLFYPLTITDRHNREHFFSEAHVLKQLHHPCILPLLDANLDKGMPYLVYAYTPSGSLQDVLRKRTARPFSLENTFAIIARIGQALQYAHEQHIIHGTIKARNILFNTQRLALLSDFTPPMLSTILGDSIYNPDTAIYKAPESLLSPLSDQYALACLTYILLTGHLPLTPSAQEKSSLMKEPLSEDTLPVPTLFNSQMPAHIERAIIKAMRYEPEKRFTSIHDFLSALGITLTASITGLLPQTDPLPQASYPLLIEQRKTQPLPLPESQLPPERAQPEFIQHFSPVTFVDASPLPSTQERPMENVTPEVTMPEAIADSNTGVSVGHLRAVHTAALKNSRKPVTRLAYKHDRFLFAVIVLILIVSLLGTIIASLTLQDWFPYFSGRMVENQNISLNDLIATQKAIPTTAPAPVATLPVRPTR